jgi:hypothetical protein
MDESTREVRGIKIRLQINLAYVPGKHAWLLKSRK